MDGFTIVGGNASGLVPHDTGRGLYLQSCGSGGLTLRQLTIKGNRATTTGAGLYGLWSSPAIVQCTLLNNAASRDGGGMGFWTGDPRIFSCIVGGNTAGQRGGGAYFSGASNPIIVNSSMAGNTAADVGGAVYASAGQATLADCTLVSNHAGSAGGALRSTNNNTTAVANCILWGNLAPNGPEVSITSMASPSRVSVSHSDVQGGQQATHVEVDCTFTWGAGNIDEDPAFVDPLGPDLVAGTADDNLALRCSSPCIDAADNTQVPADLVDLDADGDTDERIPSDLRGRPRFVDDPRTPNRGTPDFPGYPLLADMGAFEIASGVMADFDCDDDVDEYDFGAFESCASGSSIPFVAGYEAKDFD